MKRSSALTALARLLELRLEQARLALACSRRVADRAAETTRQLEQVRDVQAAAAAARLANALDPLRHRSTLEHLASLARQHAVAESELQSARVAVAQTRENGVMAERKRALVERVMQREQDRQRAEAARAQNKEADLQWLLQRAAGSPRERTGGEA